MYEGAANSSSNPYRDLYRHAISSDEGQDVYRPQAVSSSTNQRRLIYGEEDDEYDRDPNHYDPDDYEDEDEDRLGTAAQLMILREHHRRQLEEIARGAGIHEDDEDEEEAARDRANIIQE